MSFYKVKTGFNGRWGKTFEKLTRDDRKILAQRKNPSKKICKKVGSSIIQKSYLLPSANHDLKAPWEP